MSNAPKIPRKIKSGFTLIELLMVVSLLVMLMLGATSLFMTFLISNAKTSSIQLVRNEGTFALNQMEHLIRNAIAIEQVDDGGVLKTCEAGMQALAVKLPDDGVTVLEQALDEGRAKIASNAAFLTSGEVELVNGPQFDCATTTDGLNRYVTISFTLRKGAPGVDQPRDIVEQTFSRGVQLRSY